MVSFERKYNEDRAEVAPSIKESYYPHSLYLDAKDVQKLGLADAQVGNKMTLVSEVEISSVSMHENEDGKKRHSVQLRLLSGEIKKPEASKKSDAERASTLFGKEKS